MVGGGGGCRYMLLLHPVPTSADAGPDLCTIHPDLWTLCLWRFPSFNWCKHSTCTGSGCRQLQLALVVLFHSATSADSLRAHTWWCHPLQLALVVLFHPGTSANTALALVPLALCGGGQWWWYVVACGGGGIYIWNLHWHLSNLHCVVVIHSGDRCMWRQNQFLSTYISNWKSTYLYVSKSNL